MKLFLKDHIDIVLLFLFNNVVLVVSYYQLDGFSTVNGLFYYFFMSLFLLLSALVYRYYRKLEEGVESLEDMVDTDHSDRFASAFASYCKRNYQLYLSELNKSTEDFDEWQSHMVQWVHQMKTPISVIRLMVQGNPDRIDTSDIEYELDRLQNQMDRMLGFVRMGKFRNDFVIEEISLAELVRSILQKNKRQFIYHKIFPKVSVPSNIMIRSDKKWLGFVIEQILSNAIKYSKKVSDIRISAKKSGQKTELIIQDFGNGIRERDLPRIFERYYTGSNGREQNQSSGIGLYLAKAILDELEHSICVESEMGTGTRVTLLF